MRQFWKYTLASLTGTFLFFVLFTVLTVLGAFGLIGVLLATLSKGSETPVVARNSMLVYDLSTVITDAEITPDPAAVLLSGEVSTQLTLREALTALEKAAEDEHIVGLYLRGTDTVMGTGLASAMELRKAIQAFRDAGKPVVAYDVSWTEREYLLASLAEQVYMNPFGQIEMNGLYAEMMYQAEVLEKLGVGVQVTRVGKYKSAVEPFIRDDMSPEERQQTQRLLSDIWQTLITESAEDRSLQPQALQAIANDQGFLFGEEAQTRQLVDTVAYEDEVIAQIRTYTDQSEEADSDDKDGFRQISLNKYADTVEDVRQTRSSRNQIALVYAEGPIVDGEGADGFGGSQVIAGEQVARQLRQLRRDDDVKAVVLRVNSPGGSATASEIILREVRLLRDAGKPVVVSMGNVAASGGYWIASLADTIVAEPTTITGSIGVFSLFVNLQDLGDKVGVNWDGVKTADLADIFSGTRPKTPEELAILQKSVDQIYEAFLDRVVEGRDLPPATVAEIAQGRVWSGIAAQELGLVDELGGLDRALQIAADLAELEDDWQLQEYPKPDDWQRFWGSFLEARQPQTATDPLTAQVNRWMDEMTLLRLLNDPRGIYALMPFTLEFD